MNKQEFNKEYIGKKVLLVCSGEDRRGFIEATINSVNVTGINNNIALIIYKDHNSNELFFSGGITYEDKPEIRLVLEFVFKLFPTQKRALEFLGEMKNFDKNLDYFAEKAYTGGGFY
jgi:hypothetical protein